MPATLALVFCVAAHAGDFYCGDTLITTGMTGGEVRAACGKPASVTLRQAVRHRHGYGADSFDEVIEPGGEVWTFNFGPNRLLEQIVLVDDVVVEMTTLKSYGYVTR